MKFQLLLYKHLPPTTIVYMNKMIELAATEVCIFRWHDMKHIDTIVAIGICINLWSKVSISQENHKTSFFFNGFPLKVARWNANSNYRGKNSHWHQRFVSTRNNRDWKEKRVDKNSCFHGTLLICCHWQWQKNAHQTE